jgi:hypothetical protein
MDLICTGFKSVKKWTPNAGPHPQKKRIFKVNSSGNA